MKTSDNPYGNSGAAHPENARKDDDCGCSNGLCPGVILAAISLGGWFFYSLAAWLWNLAAG